LVWVGKATVATAQCAAWIPAFAGMTEEGFAFTFRCFLIILGYLFLFASPSFQ
jgi:hypothetical protein